MIQYYRDLENQVKTIRDKNLEYGQIQKMYSTAYYISIAIRVPGKTHYLYLGRGGGHEGIWLSDSAPIAILRRKDNFLEYFRRHLSACSFLNLTLDKKDRIVCINYQKFGSKQSILLFWRGRKLYFLHHFMDAPDSPYKLLLSWKSKSFIPSEENIDLPGYFDEVGRNNEIDHTLQAERFLGIEELLQNEEKLISAKESADNPTFLQRKKKNIEEDLRKTKQWEKLLDILNKGKSLENVYELKVDDQKIKFTSDLNPFERRDKVYQKIKKLKKGEEILRSRLEDVEEQLAGKIIQKKVINQIPMVRPIWGEEKSAVVSSEKVLKDDYRVFKFPDFQIGVGTSAQGNDQLRNKWSSKDDIWLHLDAAKSSHVIVKCLKNQTVTPDVLNLSASILAHFSHYEGDWISIIYTQVKNLKAVAGSPGMVNYKKEKRLQCQRVDINEILKN